FFEKPFQNWTRQSAEIMGTVFIHADYTIPIDAIRAELTRIVSASELWDGKVCGLQVTNATQQTIELRCLVSSKDASINWDLRCMVREKIIEFIQKTYPQCLPKLRAELKEDTEGQNSSS
ncbi:MAG: mechanosensitive ion channel family protein, partial [Nitrospirae bacterium]|nr:mechanosensitive ion channel family protein [Nitrospirota bacterium]